MKFYAIIVAGGLGTRMKADIPKQFLLLKGKPMLMHTIEAFYHSDLHPEIILVLHSQYHSLWRELCRRHHFILPYKLVEGGKERFDSVKNALSSVKDESIVAIHDAVRPIISNNLITRCFKKAEMDGSAIPVTESRDSLRKKEKGSTVAIPREEILIVQTPQVFKSTLLKKAYMQEYSETFTDDASVVERIGEHIHITEGDPRNIKITYQEDMAVASLLLDLMK